MEVGNRRSHRRRPRNHDRGVNGGDSGVLRWITHAPPRSPYDGYSREQWNRLSAEMAKYRFFPALFHTPRRQFANRRGDHADSASLSPKCGPFIEAAHPARRMSVPVMVDLAIAPARSRQTDPGLYPLGCAVRSPTSDLLLEVLEAPFLPVRECAPRASHE
jgi:hypothetical protein